MNSQKIFKFILGVAVVALILSGSRLVLSESERSEIFLWAYNLQESSQLTAFIIVIVLSALCIIISKTILKSYDVASEPLFAGGLITLIIITILCYFTNSLYIYSLQGEEFTTGNDIFVLFFLAEWLALVWYYWNKYKDENILPTPVNPTSPTHEPSKLTNIN